MKILTDNSLTVLWNRLKKGVLNNRNYEPTEFSGKGYKVLEKNIQTIDSVKKNILTSAMINQSNTIYEIRYDFDLDGKELEIQDNCCLKFEGGMLKNGKIKNAYNATISAPLYKILDNIKSDSYFNIESFYPEWLGFSQSDNSEFINQSFNYCSVCKLQPKDYQVSKTISIPHNCRLIGCGVHKTRILYTELPSEETAIIEYSKDSSAYFNHSGGVFDLDISAPNEIIGETMMNPNIIGIKSYNVITLSCLLFNIPRSILEIHTDNKYIDGSRYDNIAVYLPRNEVLKNVSCIEINAVQDCLYMNQIRADRILINNVYNGEISNVIANGYIQISSSCLTLSNIHMEENPYMKIVCSDIIVKNLYAWKSNQPNIQISRSSSYQPQRISNIVLENVEINHNTNIVGDNTHVDISYYDTNVVMRNCFRSIYRDIRSQGLFSSLSVSDNNLNSFGALKNKEYIEIKKDDINLNYYSKGFTGSETNNDWLHYYAKMFILINDKKNIYLDKTYEFDNSSNVTNRAVSLISSPFTNTICPFFEIYFGETRGVYTKKVKVPSLYFTMFFVNDNVNGYKVEDIDRITEDELLKNMTFVDSYKGTIQECTTVISDTSRCDMMSYTIGDNWILNGDTIAEHPLPYNRKCLYPEILYVQKEYCGLCFEVDKSCNFTIEVDGNEFAFIAQRNPNNNHFVITELGSYKKSGFYENFKFYDMHDNPYTANLLVKNINKKIFKVKSITGICPFLNSSNLSECQIRTVDTQGDSLSRPNLISTDEGFEYYDTTLKKKILWNGTAWVNMDGTELVNTTSNEQNV